MAADWRNFSGWNPFWANLWGSRGSGLAAGAADLTLPAGITLVTASPAHPHAGALLEKVIKFDMNSATHEMAVTNASGSALSAVIDNAKRWGLMAHCQIDFNSLIPTASDFKIMGSVATASDSSSTAEYRLMGTASTGTVQFYINNVLVATSAPALPSSGFRALEVWHIFNASGGADLATDQWVVRMSSAATGAVTWTTLINVNANSTNNLTVQINSFGSVYLGSTNTHGAGKEMNIVNVCCGWQDADNPLGIVRLDFMGPDGRSIGTNMDEWTNHDYLNVDESSVAQGQLVPDDVTTFDQNAIALLINKTQMYTMTSPTYVTGSDTVIGVRNCERLDIFAVGKGGSAQVLPVLGDGANLTVANANDQLNDVGTYATRIHTERLNPGGTAYSVADMTSVEAGARHVNAVAVTSTVRNSTCIAMIVYQKSGETGTAVEGPVMDAVLYRHVRAQGVTVRAKAPYRPPYISLFGAVAPPASVRRRQGFII